MNFLTYLLNMQKNPEKIEKNKSKNDFFFISKATGEKSRIRIRTNISFPDPKGQKRNGSYPDPEQWYLLCKATHNRR
jgi:hypothetical protein